MSSKNFQVFFDSGFHLPKEHGFSVIFLCSVLIGTILSFEYPIDYIGLLLSFLFSLVIFLSNTSIVLLVRSKFRKIHPVPLILIVITAFLLLYHKFFDLNILIFFITGFFFMVWMVVNYFNRGHTTDELVIGSMTLTLFVPLIYVNAIDFHYMTNYLFISMLLIYWLVTGFTTQLILYVQYVRKLLSIDDFVFIWLCFIVSLIPFYYYQFIAIQTIIVLIEPSIFIGYYYITKPELPDKPVFKKIGKILTIRLILYVILLSLAYFVL